MDKQLSFFESSNHDGNHSVKVAEAITRKTDPKTSRLAAEKLVASGNLHKHAMIALAIVRRFPDRTAAEIDAMAIDLYELEGRQASKRLSNIKGMKSGNIRVCSVGGNKCKTWWFEGEAPQ